VPSIPHPGWPGELSFRVGHSMLLSEDERGERERERESGEIIRGSS
jgi:hypothetical protein